jgi:hypothetical protein
VVEWPLTIILLTFLLYVLGFFDFKRYQPPRGIATVDQLIANQPETLKFATVEQGGRHYVVWIGRPRGVVSSGPPVYVFDRTGNLVDKVGDAGDSDNKFVLALYGAALRKPGITNQEVTTYCRRNRAAVSVPSDGASAKP